MSFSQLSFQNILHERYRLFIYVVNVPSKVTILQQTAVHCFRIVTRNINNNAHTRAVRKVSSHFEYLENQQGGLDVT
jgi:hypothetical protein